MSNVGQQQIKCSVGSCKHNDKTSYCTLSNISVGNDTPSGDAQTAHDTECSSFACS